MSAPTNRYVFRLMQRRGEIAPDAVFVPAPKPEPESAPASVTPRAAKPKAATPKPTPEPLMTAEELRARAEDAHRIWHAMLGIEVPAWPDASSMVQRKFVVLIAGIEDAAQERRQRAAQ